MKRKLLVGILCLALSLSFVACSSSGKKSSDKDDKKTEKVDEESDEKDSDDKNSESGKDKDKKGDKKDGKDSLGDDFSEIAPDTHPDDSLKEIEVHNLDGTVSITYQVPEGFYLVDKYGNLGVVEFDLTYENGELIGNQSELRKWDSKKGMTVCGDAEEARPMTKDNTASITVATVTSASGHTYLILEYLEAYVALDNDDVTKHIHFYYRGYDKTEVSDDELWTLEDVTEVIEKYF